MIARGFKPVVWVGAVGAAALGCYMLSLRVASERADVSTLERRIVATQQQIRSLRTELGTRGRLAQLEQWNDEVLALSAPASGQFIQGAQLARFETHETSPLEGGAEVQMASADDTPAVASPAASASAPAPAPAPAHSATPAPQRAIAPAPPMQTATMQRTSLSLTPSPVHATPAPTRAARVASRPVPAPGKRTAVPGRTPPAAAPRAVAVASATRSAPAPVRTRTASADSPHRPAATARRPSLLDARTLRDIGSAARAEHRGGARD